MADDGSKWSTGDEKGAAETFARIQYEVPAGFTEQVEGKLTILEGPRQEIAFFIMRASGGTADQAMAELDAVLSAIIQDVKPAGEPVKRAYNGMPGLQMKATGTFQGKPVNVTLRFLEAQGGKIAVVAGAYLSEKKEEMKDTFNKFFSSVKPG